MLRSVAMLALAIGLTACGDGDRAERVELADYASRLKEFDGRNLEIMSQIERLDDPSIDVSAEDLEQVRGFIAAYISDIEKIDPVSLEYRRLRQTHKTYVSKVSQANELAVDTGKPLRNERGNVSIAIRHLEKRTRAHHTALDVLWLQKKIEDPFPLAWPEE
tara:strand:+ start:37 stop:522 length:486 start_codon:yes stop_codon:yes gene_type:complete